MNKKELEQFVAEHDAQVALNVQFDGASWSPEHLIFVLEDIGFSKGPNGSMRMWDVDALSVSINPNYLTLALNAPLSVPEDCAFERMINCAKYLTRRLGGAIVDSAGQPLSHSAIDEIHAQVAEFYSSMEAAGIPAGSPEALRLFGEKRGMVEITIPSRYRYSLWNVVFGCFVGWNLVLAIIFLVQDKPLSGLVLLGMVALCAWGALWPDKQAKDGSASR